MNVPVHLADDLADLLSEALRGDDVLRWTACGLPAEPGLVISADRTGLTCGNCKRTRVYAARQAA